MSGSGAHVGEDEERETAEKVEEDDGGHGFRLEDREGDHGPVAEVPLPDAEREGRHAKNDETLQNRVSYPKPQGPTAESCELTTMTAALLHGF